MSTPSWILTGAAKACGGWEMGQRSFLAGLLGDVFHFNKTSSLCRFARRFDQESDLHTMRFQLNRWTNAKHVICFRSLWEGLPLSKEKELVLRLAYFDRYLLSHSWRIQSVSVELGYFKWSTTAFWEYMRMKIPLPVTSIAWELRKTIQVNGRNHNMMLSKVSGRLPSGELVMLLLAKPDHIMRIFGSNLLMMKTTSSEC